MSRLFTPFNIIAALLVAAVIGVRFMQALPPQIPIDDSVQPRPVVGAAQVSLRLHFAQADTRGWGIETRNVTVTPDTSTGRANAVLREWMSGPKLAGLIPLANNLPMPKVFVRRETVYVDAPIAWTKKQIGSAGELLLYCGIANSLLELEGFTKIQFLLEGQIADSIGGHMVTRHPLQKKTCQG